ncbi:NAD(P)-binding protein [Polychaeton citri CBS 116435]|uniref:NAD(P)-binding protein n=1 Tax=Polychaeton citri CBS 116435 TaxID=1314669 RepID=A0A9P4Q0E8_9PEZI|nr:NAD(P)-binding protein [Polychaeton citri CBS 116435]
MSRLLEGKVAAITGGVTGIGRAIALEYLNHGAYIAVNHYPDAQSAEHASTLQQEASVRNADDRLQVIPGDITSPDFCTSFIAHTIDHFSQQNRLDIFISNAGIFQWADFLTLEPDLLRRTVETNLNGAFFAVQAAARQMASQSPAGGSTIGLSSISALVGGATQTHYTPTKAGVLSLMQSCACALGKHNIRCNALLPGTIRTQLNEESLQDQKNLECFNNRIPLGRVGRPEDMAGPAVFLGSDLSGYVSGAQLLVDGGLFVNLQ